MAKKDIWDIIIWVALIILIGYILAKILGIINTPEWLNLLPLITIVFLVGAFYQKVLHFMDVMYHRTDYFKKHLKMLGETTSNHTQRLSALETIPKKRHLS